jgi:predicted Rossmann fold nucleotide-binding protein DprA/Smf involved in DNA uptake
VTAPVLEVLGQREARRLVSQARNALALADDLLARLYAGRAWVALGHADWSALCAAELPELRHLKMRAAPRRARVAALHALGASVREIAAATGASVGSVHGDIATLAARGGAPAPVAGLRDDSVRPLPAHVRVAEVVAAAGAAGLTIPQVQRRLGWTYGATSGALSRAERRGLVCRPPQLEPRGGFRPYRAAL